MVKVITDGAADLSKEYLEKHPEIDVLPLKTTYKNENLENISKKDFYNLLKNLDEEYPKTAMVSPEDFRDVFLKNIENEIIYIALGSGYSGTYKSAFIARDLLEEEGFNIENIYIYDTETVSACEALFVDIAYEKMKQGLNAAEIIEYLNQAKKHIKFICTVNDLKYLYAGGRLSRLSTVLGISLNIKPLLTAWDNKISAIGKVRGTKKAAEYLLNEINPEKTDRVFIMKGLDTPVSESFESQNKFFTTCFSVGPVIATHAGPECFGIAVLEKF